MSISVNISVQTIVVSFLTNLHSLYYAETKTILYGMYLLSLVLVLPSLCKDESLDSSNMDNY